MDRDKTVVRSRRIQRLATAATAFLALSLLTAAPALAATVDLDWSTGVGNQGTTTIAPGDTVRWTWVDSLPHTVTSTDGGFTSSSTVAGNGFTYEVTFNDVGSFPYDCAIHSSMRGTISVVASAPVPLLSPPMLFGLLVLVGGAGTLSIRRRRHT